MKVPELVGQVTVPLGVLVVGAALGIWAPLNSRIDGQSADITAIKVDAARTATAVEFMRSDIGDVKQSLQSIDNRLAASGLKNPAGYFAIDNPAEFFKNFPADKLRGPIYIDAPNPETQSVLKNYLSRKPRTPPAPEPKP